MATFLVLTEQVLRRLERNRGKLVKLGGTRKTRVTCQHSRAHIVPFRKTTLYFLKLLGASYLLLANPSGAAGPRGPQEPALFSIGKRFT